MESSIKREKATIPQIMCSVGLVRGCKYCFVSQRTNSQIPTNFCGRDKEGKNKIRNSIDCQPEVYHKMSFWDVTRQAARCPAQYYIVITTFYYFPWV
ncbi:hypothetical protein I7I48_11949 [Histoplasma ohiense]|nr:hypothetical protein I7I48_11949 [Histoplasma ohiense (nom. inval.)]